MHLNQNRRWKANTPNLSEMCNMPAAIWNFIMISFGLVKTNIPHIATDLQISFEMHIFLSEDYENIWALHKGIIVHIETVSLPLFYHYHHSGPPTPLLCATGAWCPEGRVRKWSMAGTFMSRTCCISVPSEVSRQCGHHKATNISVIQENWESRRSSMQQCWRPPDPLKY